jgi:vacuolar-type H+-ATPase catalytic subunit A/Vma1
MHGILHSHYKLVEEYINKLQEENLTNSYCPYYENILQHKQTLSEIYKNYRETFEHMSIIIKQFEEHKQSIKRLIILQKKKKKEMLKTSHNNSPKKIFKNKESLVA